MIPHTEIAAEVEALGLEIVALREKLRATAQRFHAQGMARGGVTVDPFAWRAFLACWRTAKPLYSHGHALKRFGRKLRLDLGEDGGNGNGGAQ